MADTIINARAVVNNGALTVRADGPHVIVDPYITAEETDDGVKLTVKNANGDTSTATVYNGEQGPAGKDGKDGQDGADGISAGFGTPTASVDGNTGTPGVTVAASGPDTAKVFAFAFTNLKGATGAAGQNGTNGANGVSPAVTISSITGGHSVKITDADHPSGQSFNVMDGTDGAPGANPISFTVTLLAASWSSNALTVSDAKIISSGYAYIVSPASSSFAAYGEAGIYADDVSTNGSMTFHCADTPSSNLTVNVVRLVVT